MRLEYQIIGAIVLDLLFGDPRWFPHPVKYIGRSAAAIEQPMRRIMKNDYAAGILTTALVVLGTAFLTYGIIYIARQIHPLFGSIVSMILLYTTFAAKDLADHSMNVYQALKNGDLIEARRKVSWIVGRDTDHLTEDGVVRAAVESVAENTTDGVIAPLIFGIIGGPIGAMAYKAVSTLDSIFGYKNERYIHFGWASARLDDLIAYIPARITVFFMILAAAILRRKPANAFRICIRDGRKHQSPNSGLSEAAMAGALGVQLGGPVYRKGHLDEMPVIGEPDNPLHAEQIPAANLIMLATYGSAAIIMLTLRLVLSYWL